MATCEVCGNEYRHTIRIERDGHSHVFDSFECAIHALAPTCEHCGVKIIGHGIQAEDDRVFCCAHCAREAGVEGVADHAGAANA